MSAQYLCTMKSVHYLCTGCPTLNYTASMGLNYDLGDKSENLRRMNLFEKFIKAIRNFICKKG